MIDLAGNSDYADELDRHRAMMDEWLAAGDMGEEDESIAALKANGEGTKWGEGVNVEYEAYRVDSDGDGLSDKWETLNGRDPLDGRLYFAFDCGAWQTEGWFSEDISSNLAGSLGTLDFELDGDSGKHSARRTEYYHFRSRQRIKFGCTIQWGSKRYHLTEWTDSWGCSHRCLAYFQTTSLDLNILRWSDSIQSLEFTFLGDAGTLSKSMRYRFSAMKYILIPLFVCTSVVTAQPNIIYINADDLV